MKLNELRDNAGASRSRTRVGRGIGSGKGKTAARGQKGQKSRSGVAIKGFEGGQMPLARRLPKRGFKNIFSKHYAAVNVGRVQAAIDAGKLDAKSKIDAEALRTAGVIKHIGDGLRLLGHGDLSSKLSFEVTGASKGAVTAVEKAGGSITIKAPKGASATPDKADKPGGKSAGA